MSLFGAMDTASTGVHLSRVWMDAVSDNVANLNTVRKAGEEPFRARLVVAQTRPGLTGVQVAGIQLKPGDPVMTYDPQNPLADANGNVTQPQVDLSEEMTHMLVSQRLYQANLAMIQQARDTYQAALSIGRAR
jgi:flagellar basal-body rod protein FlgC